METRNEADNAVYRNEKLLKDNGDKISGDVKSKLEKAIADVKEALKGSDSAAIKSASEKLNETAQLVGQELYKAAADKTRGGGPGPEAGGQRPEAGGQKPEEGKKDEGPIIDAEVVDEKK